MNSFTEVDENTDKETEMTETTAIVAEEFVTTDKSVIADIETGTADDLSEDDEDTFSFFFV